MNNKNEENIKDGAFFVNDKLVFSGKVEFDTAEVDFTPFLTPHSWLSTYHPFTDYILNTAEIDVKVPGKVIEMTFANGEKTKAVCSDSDTFNLETGINVCLLKYLLHSSSKYNNLVSKIVKNYNNKIKAAEAEKENKELEEQRKAKKQAKYNAYKQRKIDKENERQINIQKEAYVRALKEVGLVPCTDKAFSYYEGTDSSD